MPRNRRQRQRASGAAPAPERCPVCQDEDSPCFCQLLDRADETHEKIRTQFGLLYTLVWFVHCGVSAVWVLLMFALMDQTRYETDFAGELIIGSTLGALVFGLLMYGLIYWVSMLSGRWPGTGKILDLDFDRTWRVSFEKCLSAVAMLLALILWWGVVAKNLEWRKEAFRDCELRSEVARRRTVTQMTDWAEANQGEAARYFRQLTNVTVIID